MDKKWVAFAHQYLVFQDYQSWGGGASSWILNILPSEDEKWKPDDHLNNGFMRLGMTCDGCQKYVPLVY